MAESQRGWYRKRSQAVDILRYDGGFPLDFLRDDETVSAGDRGDGDCFIESPARLPVYIERGYVLIREMDGTLTTYPSAEQFDAEYEPVAAQASQGNAVRCEGEDCRRCGRHNTIWFAPSPLWNAVMRGGSINGEPKYEDVVCATCFMELAEKAGIASRFRVFAQELNVELETTTPSGRVWDEDRQLWAEPDSQPQHSEGEEDCDDLCICGHERFHHDDGRSMGVETNCKAARCRCKQFEAIEPEEYPVAPSEIPVEGER